MKGMNKPDGRTIELVRRGIINADSGKVNRTKAIKSGIIPPSKATGSGRKK